MFGAAMCVFAVCTACAVAQCREWNVNEHDGVPGVDGTVNDVLVWDADGPGPAPPALVVSGNFGVAGTARAKNIALFDDRDWHAMGSGLTPLGNGHINTLCTYRGQLFAGGSFTRANGAPSDGLARWDGVAWRAVANLWHSDGAYVSSMLEYDGRLIVSGLFSQIEGSFAGGTAAWDGATLSPLGMGGQGHMCVHEGRLHKTTIGSIPVVEWNGEQWIPMGTPLDVNAGASICSHLGSLFAACLGHVPGNTVPHVRRWDGVTWPVVAGWGPAAADMQSFDNQMWAGLSYCGPACGVSGALGRWHGAGWASSERVNGAIRAITRFGDRWVLGGPFQVTTDRTRKLSGIAVTADDGATLEPISPGRLVRPVLIAVNDRGDVAVESREYLSNYPELGRVHLRDESGWHDLGPFHVSAGSSLIWYEGSLIRSGLSRWDGSGWTAMASGTGVYAIAVIDGALHGARSVQNAQGTWQIHVVRWDGSNWVLIGQNFSAAINGLGVWQGDLVAVGAFTSVGGVQARGLARWDGQAWHELAGGADGIVHCVADLGGDLVIGGTFSAAGGVPAAAFAVYDGAVWSAAGEGLVGVGNAAPAVTSMSVADGELFVAGAFSRAGGRAATNLAIWNGDRWETADLELAHRDGWLGTAMLAAGGQTVAVAGSFDRAGGRTAMNFARLRLIRPTCRGDFDCSGGVDGQDVEQFFLAWEAGNARADLNEDGGLDNEDIGAFFAAWESGC